jgi:hypothetical protein
VAPIRDMIAKPINGSRLVRESAFGVGLQVGRREIALPQEEAHPAMHFGGNGLTNGNLSGLLAYSP